MNVQRQVKAATVKEVSEKLSNAKALVVAEYAGLTVKELQELRNLLEAKGVEIKVYKNRLFRVAAKEAGHDLDEHLVGPNIYAFGMEDEISPAKVLAEFAKEHEALKLKAGIYEGEVVGADVIAEVATLPSMEEALTMLATSLLAPVNQIGKGLQLLIDEGKLEAPAVEESTEEAKEETKEEAPAEVAKEA